MKTMLAAAIMVLAMATAVANAEQPQPRAYAMSDSPKAAQNSDPVRFNRAQTGDQSQLTWQDIQIGNPRLTGVLPNGILATYN